MVILFPTNNMLDSMLPTLLRVIVNVLFKESQSNHFQKFHGMRVFLESGLPWILQYQKNQ